MERNKWFNIKILKDDTFNTKGLKKGDYFLLLLNNLKSRAYVIHKVVKSCAHS